MLGGNLGSRLYGDVSVMAVFHGLKSLTSRLNNAINVVKFCSVLILFQSRPFFAKTCDFTVTKDVIYTSIMTSKCIILHFKGIMLMHFF